MLGREAVEGGSETEGGRDCTGSWEPESSADQRSHPLAEEAPRALVISQPHRANPPWRGSASNRASSSGLLSALGASPKGDLGTTKKILLCREDQFSPWEPGVGGRSGEISTFPSLKAQ